LIRYLLPLALFCVAETKTPQNQKDRRPEHRIEKVMNGGVDGRFARSIALQIGIFIKQFGDKHNEPAPDTVWPPPQYYCRYKQDQNRSMNVHRIIRQADKFDQPHFVANP
jgi:hypothetical protein